LNRRVSVDPITRLEGHGRIDILLDEEGNALHALLKVPELRGFESFCVGRPAEEMPTITAAVCGVCPSAHHLASARALDDLFGAVPPPAAARIRELYYQLFLFEDHLLHFFFLGGPDFLTPPGTGPAGRNVLGVAEVLGKETTERLFDLRGRVRSCMSLMAGRAVHPVFAVPGGVTRPLDGECFESLASLAPAMVSFAQDVLALFFEKARVHPLFQTLERDGGQELQLHSLGLVDGGDRLDFLGETVRVVEPGGAEILRFSPPDYLSHLSERVEPWTYVKFPFLRSPGWKGLTDGRESGLYRVGPLGRVNASRAMATPLAQKARLLLEREMGGPPLHRTMAYHGCRLLEVLQAAERTQALLGDPLLQEREVRSGPSGVPRRGVGAVGGPPGGGVGRGPGGGGGVGARGEQVVGVFLK
jgi:F420-non-reducing hydrogenase large subunit